MSRRNSSSSRTQGPLLWIPHGLGDPIYAFEYSLGYEGERPSTCELRLGDSVFRAIWIEGDTCTIPLDH